MGIQTAPADEAMSEGTRGNSAIDAKEQVLKEIDGATNGANVKTYKGNTLSPEQASRVAKANPPLKQSARDS